MALAIIGSAGSREIVLSLDSAASLVVRAARNFIGLDSIWLSGETTAANCSITVAYFDQKDDTTEVVCYYVEANTAAATKYNVDKTFSRPGGRVFNGLKVTTAGAWSAASRMIFYTT